MYYRGIILDIKDGYCIVMTDDGRFCRIKTKKGVREGDGIFFLDEDLSEGPEEAGKSLPAPAGKRRGYRKIVAVAAAVMVCILILAVPRFTQEEAYATVSFDMGQDVQVYLDSDGRIVDAESFTGYFDEDGPEDIKGMTLSEFWDDFSMDEANIGKVAVVGYAASGEGTAEMNRLRRDIEGIDSEGGIFIRGDSTDVEDAVRTGETLGSYLMSSCHGEEDLEDMFEYTMRADLVRYIETIDDPEMKRNAERYMKILDDIKESDIYDDYFEDDDDDEEEEEED